MTILLWISQDFWSSPGASAARSYMKPSRMPNPLGSSQGIGQLKISSFITSD